MVRGAGDFVGRFAPMMIFSFVYVATCLLGAILLVADYRPYAALFEYFTGFRAPVDRGDLIPIQLALLTVAPILMWLGYIAAMKIRMPWTPADSRPAHPVVPANTRWLPHLIFYTLILAGLISLISVGSLLDVRAWFDPQTSLEARYRAFRDLSFFEFVLLYTLIPVAAAWVALTVQGGNWVAHIVRWLPVFLAIAISLLLFQKRPALNDMIIVSSAVILAVHRTNPFRARLGVAAGLAGLVVCYLVLIMVPVLFETRVQLTGLTDTATPSPRVAPSGEAVTNLPSPPDINVSADYPVTPQLGAMPPATSAPAVLTEAGKPQGVLLYALLGPINRTSISALYYPEIFPDKHSFYGLDVGQDMLSKLPWFDFPRMPDDNIVVWNYLAPSMPGGRMSAPFQFGLYSQVGVLWALVGAVLVGGALAMVWRFVRNPMMPGVWASLGGALVVLLSVFLALDSARNSLLASYGVFWGFLFVAGAAGLQKVASFAEISVRRSLAATMRVPTTARGSK